VSLSGAPGVFNRCELRAAPLNLNVMQAALAAKIHYIDLGGLFTWTRRQLKLHQDFLRAGLTAIIGMVLSRESPILWRVMLRTIFNR
jgi:hypothetical protein